MLKNSCTSWKLIWIRGSPEKKWNWWFSADFHDEESVWTFGLSNLELKITRICIYLIFPTVIGTVLLRNNLAVLHLMHGVFFFWEHISLDFFIFLFVMPRTHLPFSEMLNPLKNALSYFFYKINQVSIYCLNQIKQIQ